MPQVDSTTPPAIRTRLSLRQWRCDDCGATIFTGTRFTYQDYRTRCLPCSLVALVALAGKVAA